MGTPFYIINFARAKYNPQICRFVGYLFSVRVRVLPSKRSVSEKSERLDCGKVLEIYFSNYLLQTPSECDIMYILKKVLLCSWWCSILNHNILYGIARPTYGCQAPSSRGRQKQAAAFDPPCTCRFMKWHHTASWDFLVFLAVFRNGGKLLTPRYLRHNFVKSLANM